MSFWPPHPEKMYWKFFSPKISIKVLKRIVLAFSTRGSLFDHIYCLLIIFLIRVRNELLYFFKLYFLILFRGGGQKSFFLWFSFLKSPGKCIDGIQMTKKCLDGVVFANFRKKSNFRQPYDYILDHNFFDQESGKNGRNSNIL